MKKMILLACALAILCALTSFTSARASDSWATPIPAPPSVDQLQKYGFKPLDYQTTFCDARPDTYAPLNRQTSVGVPGTIPMGFTYLMRLLYPEFEANFTIQTDSGSKRPYVLPNFRQTSPGGWLPGAVSEWDYEGIHYAVTYVMIPSEPQPVDIVHISLKNTSNKASKSRLAVTLDGAPTLKADGGLISDRGKPLAIMDPIVPARQIKRDSGVVDPRVLAACSWHPGMARNSGGGWLSNRTSFFGLPIEYMLKSDVKPIQIFLGFKSAYDVCDSVVMSVEGAPEPRRLDLKRALDISANTLLPLDPYVERFVGRDTDGDGYIKVSVVTPPDSPRQRALLSVIRAYDESVAVTAEDIAADKKIDKTKYNIDVGADFPSQIDLLSVGKDPTVFALDLDYGPTLSPGEERQYTLKLPAIDRREASYCGCTPRTWETGESWKHLTQRDPIKIPKEEYAVFGPKSRDLWRKQLAAAQNLTWDAGMARLKQYWESFVSRGAKVITPEATINNIYKKQIVTLSLHRILFTPYDYGVGADGPEFYWDHSPRSSCYEYVAWDWVGIPEMAKPLWNTWVTARSKQPQNHWASGQWDDGDPMHEGMWQTRVNQWDAQGQTLWALTEHYLLSGDKKWLVDNYDCIRKGGDWIIRMIEVEKKAVGDPNNPAYGLLIPGGNEPPIGGPHSYYNNGFALLGLRRCAMAARVAGKTDDAARFDAATAGLKTALDRAMRSTFVRLNDFAGTIPPSVEESKWAVERANGGAPVNINTDFAGALLWPCEAIEPHDPLVDALYAYREYQGRSSGGLMTWPYIYAEQGVGYICRGEYDKACDLFYAYVANASGTLDWGECLSLGHVFNDCDPPRVGLKDNGESPHTWATAFYIEWLRHMMLHEDGDTLHIAPAIPRKWLAAVGAGFPNPAPTVGLEGAPSYFGPVTYHLIADPDQATIRGDVKLDPDRKPAKLIIHVRGPGGRGLRSVTLNGKKWDSFAGDEIIVSNPPAAVRFEAKYLN